MIAFDLKVGFSCNNDCIHCVVADKRCTRDLTTTEIKNIIDKVNPAYSIVFTGGEPTIRPDFLELIKYAREIKRHRVELQTNGTMFSDESFAMEAVKYIDIILIALHAANPEVHDKIVRIPGMFDKTLKGFRNILKYRQDCESQTIVATQTVISKWNISTLLDTYTFIQDLLPETEMHMTYPHPMGNAYLYSDIVVPRYSEIQEYLQKCLEQYARYINTEAIPICYLYPYHDQCGNDSVRLIKNKPLRPGLDPANKSSSFFNEEGEIIDYTVLELLEKQKSPECMKCDFNSECVGVWKEYISIHKSNLDLIPITKTKG